eukprot:529377-Prymnesium_polylepis.1
MPYLSHTCARPHLGHLLRQWDHSRPSTGQGWFRTPRDSLKGVWWSLTMLMTNDKMRELNELIAGENTMNRVLMPNEIGQMVQGKRAPDRKREWSSPPRRKGRGGDSNRVPRAPPLPGCPIPQGRGSGGRMPTPDPRVAFPVRALRERAVRVT